MKKIILSSTLLMGLAFSSCSDSFLDQYPKGRWHEKNMPESNLDQAILAEGKLQQAYASLKDWNNLWPVFAMNNYSTPEGEKGSNPSDGGADVIAFEQMTYNPSNGLINGYYSICYSTIYTVHETLLFIDQMPDANPKKAIYKSEALFMRALMYYRLTQAFGDVPYIDHMLGKNEKLPARMNMNEVRARYIQDLEKAIPNLSTRPQLVASGNGGRPTKNAALAIIAKTYLYEQNWQLAKEYSLKIINSGENNLSTPFDKIFDEESEFGPESILEVNCEQKPSLKIYMGSMYAQMQGFRGTPDLGWGFNAPSSSLVADFRNEHDPRINSTVIANGETLEGFVMNADPNSHPFFNKKAYVRKAEIAKYGRSDRDFGNWKNIRLIRYSDVLLMYAEACCEIGDDANITEALEKLEMVRKRARNGQADLLPKVTTRVKNELRDAIRKERKFELALEFERFYDLVRWGIAKDVIPGFVSGKHELYPIPQNEIDKSNGILTQNPGYN